MKTLAGIVVSLFMFVGIADAASTLFTIPIFNGGDAITCSIVNVSTNAQTLQIQALDGGGAVIYDSGAFNAPAGQVTAAAVPLGTYYCKFIASDVAASVRAAAYTF